MSFDSLGAREEEDMPEVVAFNYKGQELYRYQDVLIDQDGELLMDNKGSIMQYIHESYTKEELIEFIYDEIELEMLGLSKTTLD